MFNSLNTVLDFYEQVGDGRSQNAHVTNNQLDRNLRRINERENGVVINRREMSERGFGRINWED